MLFRGGFQAVLTWILAAFAVIGGGSQTIRGDGSVFVPTYEQLDLAINGPGYFELRDEVGKTYFTRWGKFQIDSKGYLTTPNNYRLQGNSGDLRISYDAALSSLSELPPDARLQSYEIKADGTVQGVLSDGTGFSMGQILLRSLSSPDAGEKFYPALILDRGNLGASAQRLVPGSGGLGLLSGGMLEIPLPELSIHGKVGHVQGSGKSVLVGSYIDTDVAIYGRGYFVLRDPASGKRFATRAGAFYWDEEDYLVNYTGLRVQGFMNEISRIDDVRADWHNQIPGPESVTLGARWIEQRGKVMLALSDGTRFEVGQIFLSDFEMPQPELKQPFGVYEFGTGVGAEPGVPDENGLGMIFANQQDVAEMDAAIVGARKRMNFFLRGPFVNTGRKTDVYIIGDGFFTLRNASNDAFFATRKGAFHLDTQNYLVTEEGLRVQGLNSATQSGGMFASVAGDIQIDVPAGLDMADFSIREDGRIRIHLKDGSEFDRAQIRLQSYRKPRALIRGDHYLYSNVENALPEFAVIGIEPGNGGSATLISGFVEDIQPEPGIQIPSPDAIHLTLRNHPSGGMIEASSDFVHWTRLPGPNFSILDAAEFFDEPSSDNAPRFYRVQVSTDIGFHPLPLVRLSPSPVRTHWAN